MSMLEDAQIVAAAPAQKITIWKWVRHEKAAEYEALGWRNTGPLPGPHGEWSVGMEWQHAGEPILPGRKA